MKIIENIITLIFSTFALLFGFIISGMMALMDLAIFYIIFFQKPSDLAINIPFWLKIIMYLFINIMWVISCYQIYRSERRK